LLYDDEAFLSPDIIRLGPRFCPALLFFFMGESLPFLAAAAVIVGFQTVFGTFRDRDGRVPPPPPTTSFAVLRFFLVGVNPLSFSLRPHRYQFFTEPFLCWFSLLEDESLGRAPRVFLWFSSKTKPSFGQFFVLLKSSDFFFFLHL